MRQQRIGTALAAMFVLFGIGGGAAACAVLDGGDSNSSTQSSVPTTDAAASAATAVTTPTSPPGAAAPSSELPPPVLAAAGVGKAPQAAALSKKITSISVKNLKGSYSGSVIDVGSGRVLFNHNARTPHIPASTMKVMTSSAALSILGADHRFSTSVVGPQAGQIVLVGGGDPYLAKIEKASAYPRRASIDDLARMTAEGLHKAKITRVRLGYDTSLFRGPAWNPFWPDAYSYSVSRISALWLDEGRLGSATGPRVKDPAKEAAIAFEKAVEKRGISVTSVMQAAAPSGVATLATVRSLPLQRIVEQLLLTSDNDAAEVLLRQAAIGREREGSTVDGLAVVREQLSKLGVWSPGTTMKDGSGLARESRVPADTLAKLLRLAAGDDHPELRAVITGLPVAGVEGSLRVRFFDDQSLAGRGVVRAKTGTLRKVHSLAGVARTADGSLLTFAFLINNPKNDFAANVWLDRVTTAISRCGCGSS